MAGRGHRSKLGDYFTLQRGTTYKSRLLGQPGPVLLGLATIQRNGGFRTDSLKTYGGESPDKLLVRPGELYLSLKDVTQSADLLGAVARLPIDHPPGRLTQDTVKLEPKGTEVPLDYLYWLLRTPQYRSYCRAHATGTTNLGLAREDFLAFPAAEPTPTQLRVVATLGKLDDKIELNRRMNETLEAMARALFKSWFVDFDPARAKAEGRDPSLPKPLADLFPDSFQDSGLGEIPKDWRFGNISDLCDAIYSGGTPSTQNPDYWEGDIPWLSSGETREKFITHTERRITPAGVSNSSTRLAPALSTVIASAGQGNTRGQTSLLTIESYVNQSVVVLTADPSTSSPCYLFFDLERRYEEFRRVSDAHSSRGSLTTKLLAGLPAVLPPIQVIRRFESIVMSAVERVVSNLSESRTLAVMRDTLLPKLISGELRVKDAERVIEIV